MEFYCLASSSSSSSQSSSTITSSCVEICKHLTIKALTGNIISVIVSLFLGIVGTLFGAINGAIICRQSDNSYIRGAVVGAISGVLLSVEVFESFHRLWSSDGKGFQSLLYLGGVLISLVNGKLISERVGPVLFYHRRPIHMSSGIETSFEDYFEDNKCKGLSVDIVEKIPRVEITSENCADSCGQIISCTVCLEDFQVGEEARTLPNCKHMFHPCCIDQWLMKCCSCPLCRHTL